MDYLYENLGDERFQEFCTSLIAQEYSDFQAYPVGQKDGGRDCIAFLGKNKEFIVFQVKYVQNPSKYRVPHAWLTKTINEEAPKIEKLIPRGAVKFYLITNIKGTAALDEGSIDKVNKILQEKISIPSYCWWRDDLSRRLEKTPSLKWSYPQLLNGQDLLTSIIFQNTNEGKEKRERVVKAYLADQYEIDNEVKFKQIELQNKLFDLFTDVPIQIKEYAKSENRKGRNINDIVDEIRRDLSRKQKREDEDSVGAAAFLLDKRTQEYIERILLEGAPGQGKSTISQYICQVHRARLLNKTYDLKLLPDYLQQTPIRLPFKIDLRDIASWIEENNPYQHKLNETSFKNIWKKSLESFLVGHIIYHSQLEFSSNELIDLMNNSSILFVFDGFDEIASIGIRKEVIEFINKGINRLLENSKSIQILITSRPAAFSDTVSFPIDQYPHFELTNMTPRLINEYANKWIKTNKLEEREAADIKKLVEEKLKMPHLKELAKNPMQLAIFISLLRTRGESLPNKRTALYDSYIDLFFNREAEKNYTIRDNRDLILDIHQYLAWVLHADAELLNTDGRIQVDRLKQVLKEYLGKEGHDVNIADKLFDALKERVCALVSRLQGTYEFEVQPLREYFCAKYLYNTSPYSPTGNEKKGTKAERFDAISKRFYWNNVVRFFAGCFDKGELPLLIQKLKELSDDDILKYTSYPSLLTTQILSDWVFTQYPISLKESIEIILTAIRSRRILSYETSFFYDNDDTISLPVGCGRDKVVAECFAQLKKFPCNDYAFLLISIIRNNPDNNLKYWEDHIVQLKGKQLVTWLEYGYALRLSPSFNKEIFIRLIKQGDSAQILKKLYILMNWGYNEIINKNQSLKAKVLDGILDGALDSNFNPIRRGTQFNALAILIKITFASIGNFALFPVSFNNTSFICFIFQHRYHRFDNQDECDSIMQFEAIDSVDKKIKKFTDSMSSYFSFSISEWQKKFEIWDVFVENYRKFLGDKLAIQLIAIGSARIKPECIIDTKKYCNLHNNTLSLCQRVRYARMKSGDIKYWENQMADSTDSILTFLIFFTWATPRTICELLFKADNFVNSLEGKTYSKLIRALMNLRSCSRFSPSQEAFIEKNITNKKISDRLRLILSCRLTSKYRGHFIYKNINNDNFEHANNIKLEYLINEYFADMSNTSLLDEIKILFSKIQGISLYDCRYYVRERHELPNSIPFEIAKKIMQNSNDYPPVITHLAERSCRLFANKKILAVKKIAEKEEWFE